MGHPILDDLPAAASQVARRPKIGEEELRQRLSTGLDRLLALVSQPAVSSALAAATVFDSLSLLLDSLLQEHPEVALIDQRVADHVRLVQARRELLERGGGTYDTSEAAKILGITPEAVRKRVQRGSLLSYRTPSGEHRLPRAQFSESGVLEGLEAVVRAMHVEDPWMRIQLFLDRDVLGALGENRVDDAVAAVASYLPMDEYAD
jgi:hypothetical protein